MTGSPCALPRALRSVRREGAPLLLLAAFFLAPLAGCAASPELQILTSANAFAFYEARYTEACVDVVGPAGCGAQHGVLVRWKARLEEAQAALGRGGRLPLQLEELQGIEKEARRWGR